MLDWTRRYAFDVNQRATVRSTLSQNHLDISVNTSLHHKLQSPLILEGREDLINQGYYCHYRVPWRESSETVSLNVRRVAQQYQS